MANLERHDRPHPNTLRPVPGELHPEAIERIQFLRSSHPNGEQLARILGNNRGHIRGSHAQKLHKALKPLLDEQRLTRAEQGKLVVDSWHKEAPLSGESRNFRGILGRPNGQ